MRPRLIVATSFAELELRLAARQAEWEALTDAQRREHIEMTNRILAKADKTLTILLRKGAL